MLLIEITRKSDCTVLTCTRQDGSTTWQKQTRHAAHFVFHDLTHYAVETTLLTRQGFFGLIASGWHIEATTGKGSRRPLPPEALDVEKIVGLFDSERVSGRLFTQREFNEFSPTHLTSRDIDTVRRKRDALFQSWFALKIGDKLELLLAS